VLVVVLLVARRRRKLRRALENQLEELFEDDAGFEAEAEEHE
jgi:hypothetical protein